MLFTDCKLVYVISSGGGGTGSGLLPLVTNLLTTRLNDKMFCSVMGMPLLKASARELRNAGKCFGDLAKNGNHSIKVFTTGENIDETDDEMIESLIYPFLPRR